MHKTLALSFFFAALAGSANAIDLKFNRIATGLGAGTVKLDGSSKHVGLGKLEFKIAGGGTLTSVCGNLAETLNSNSNAYVEGLTNASVTTPGIDLAGRIVAKHFHSALTNDQAAGLQLAVWEAIYDGGSAFTATSGRFQTTDSRLQNAVGFAATYYTAIATPGTARSFMSNVNGAQDQLSAVPEPASFAAVAVGAMGLIRRRTRR